MDDEVFLSKHTHNSFVDLGKLSYVDFRVYVKIVLDHLTEMDDQTNQTNQPNQNQISF